MLSFLLPLVLVYLGVLGLLYSQQRRLVFVPDRAVAVPAEWGLPEFRVVTVSTEDGLAIDGWYAAGLPGRPTVVLFHGNGGHLGMRRDKALALRRDGLGVWLAGYRGYGGNGGTPTEAGLYADARAQLDFLVGQGVSGRGLILWGESLGTGVAVQMAVERRVGALILEAAFTSLPDVAASLYPIFPVHSLVKDRFDSLAKIDRVSAPLLAVHGDHDRVVPFRLGEALFAAAAPPKRFVRVPGAGHNDLMAHGLDETVRTFIAELGRSRAAAPLLNQAGPRGSASGRSTALVPRPPRP